MIERHSLGCADRVEVLLHLLNPAIANEEEETDGSHRFRFKSNIGCARWSKLTEAGSCETFGTHSAPDHFPHQLMWDHQSAESQTVEDGNFRGPRSRVSKSLAPRGGLIMVR